MLRPLLLFFLLISPLSLKSEEFGKITGKVTDNESAPVEADVKLLSLSDSSVIGGSKCDAAGLFSIDKVPYGKYKIQVSSIGYSSRVIHDVSVSSSNPAVKLDTITLDKQDISTDEILVEDEKGLIQFSADKKIFNVDQSALNKGGTALDVLKKTPLVDVDLNDNVSFRGSQNVKILINDKPMRFASLKQVPAEAIERIELITNPPAKYEAEGVTGIINIVMKKNDQLGYTGNFNAGGNYSEKVSGWGGFDLNVKKKKTALMGNLYSGNWNNTFNYDGRIDYFTDRSSLIATGLGKNHGYWIWGQGGIEQELSEGNTIGFEGSVATGKWYNSDNSKNNNLNSSGVLTSYFDQLNDRNGMWESFTGSLYFNRKLNDMGREWTGDLTFSRNRNDFAFSQFRQDYDSLSMPANNTPLDQHDTTKIKSYNLNVQTDYTHPISKETKFETGYKGTFRINDNSFTSDTMNYSINNFVSNENADNRFKLNEYINAAYGVYQSTVGNFTYKLGLRAEYSIVKGELFNDGSKFTHNYVDFFPTVNLSQKIGQYYQLQLSYSRRITRPSIWRMNPFVRKFNPRYIVVGNPELKPEYTDSYELSFMFSSNPVTVTPLFFFRQNHDVISSYNYLQDSVVSVTTFRNAAGSKAYGLDLMLNSRAFGWLNLNGTFSFYNTSFDTDPSLTDYASEEGFSWKANVRSTLTFPGLFDLEFYYNYNGKKVNYQGFDMPSSNFDAAISKSFLKDALTLSLRVADIFNTSQGGQEINADDYYSYSKHRWSSRMASLNISYQFGNTKESYQKKKKVKQNVNEKTDQQDNSNGR